MRARVTILGVLLLLVSCAPQTVASDDGAAPDLSASPQVESATTEPADSDSPEPSATAASSPEPTVVPTPSAIPEPEPTATAMAEPTTEPTELPPPTTTAEAAATAEPTATAAPTATTEPTPEPETEVEPKPDIEPTNYDGDVKAIRTENGLVLAVHNQTATGFEVVTPCYDLATVTSGLRLTGPIDILIDPGHGGDESGAVGPNGLKESTVNLQVAELVRDELLDRGFTVELTRYGDQRVAIQSRAALANALGPRVFMSIHHNGGFPDPFPVAGTEVFVQLDDPESQRLGGLVFEEIQTAFADIDADWMGSEDSFGVAWRKNDEGTDLYGVLRRTPELVSVLTEAMFISTAAEAELLALPEVLEAEAQALANALERWFTTEDPGGGYIEGIVFEGDLGNGGGTEGCVDPALS